MTGREILEMAEKAETDDGEALRLLAALPSLWKLSLNFGAPTVELEVLWGLGRPISAVEHGAKPGDERAAAIRRAIVRAAAEIGKGMP